MALTGCGFTPLYGENLSKGPDNPTVQNNFDNIYIEIIPNREGQYLRNHLMDRFYTNGRPGNPRFVLLLSKISETRTNLDVTKSSDATRAQLLLKTRLTLKDNQTKELVLVRKLHSVTSYNILQSQFTTHVSEGNARRNALDDLAHQTERHLALYFSQNHNPL